MNEIDFLPEWYKTGKRRRVNYRRQYIVVGGLFLAMLLWGFSGSYSISLLNAQVEVMENSISGNNMIAERYQKFQDEMSVLQSKVELLEKLDPGLKISCVLGELSYLSTDKVLITKLDIKSEKMIFEGGVSKAGSVRFSSVQKAAGKSMPESDVRFRVIINGQAVTAAKVTSFISEVEDSPYFCQIVPGFMKNVKDSSETNFEISCYIANYVETK